MPLWYLGAVPTEDASIATLGFVNSLAAQSLSPQDAKQKIKDYFALTNFASYSWADSVVNSTSSGQAFARQTDLTSGVLTKIPILANGLKSRANGPVALDSSGKVDPSLISRPSEQTFPILSWSPNTYTTRSGVTTEQNIATIPITSSLPSYKVFVTGTINARVTQDGQYPEVVVRVGSGGNIVARGYGLGENYRGGLMTEIKNAGSYVYQVPAWADFIDVVLIGGGGGAFNVGGGGGSAGSWASQTFARGNNINFTGVVGSGADPKNLGVTTTFGGTTTCVTTTGSMNAGGGQTGKNNFSLNNPQWGSGAADHTHNGIIYKGGVAQSTFGAAGNAPGGGGAGGAINGGRGGDGAAFFYAYTSEENNYGQVGIIPVPMNTIDSISGPNTLFVNVLRNGNSASVTTSSINPQISVMVVPS